MSAIEPKNAATPATIQPGISRVTAMNGNQAAAHAAVLARPQALAIYPIAPQTPLVEYLAQHIADGDLDADMFEAESEYAAISYLHGACLAGDRTFSATSSQGLALMFEPYYRTSTLRLPIVMCIVTREMMSPATMSGSQQDAFAVRDAGWVQIFAESVQEVLDTVIQAYKVAEDERILLPVNVCYDGYYLSHLTERVEIPDQEAVDSFLGCYNPKHAVLDPQRPMSIDPLATPAIVIEARQKHVQAMTMAKHLIPEVDHEFARIFGRSHGGLTVAYWAEDADMLLVTTGSVNSTAAAAVDRAREAGIKIGLLRVRVMRPFPSEEVAAALSRKRAVGILDRNVNFGWGGGSLWMEIMAALYSLPSAPILIDFVYGLGGGDVNITQLEQVIARVAEAAEAGGAKEEVVWVR